MAALTVTIAIRNQTGLDLLRVVETTEQGHWLSGKQPPQRITSSGEFRAAADTVPIIDTPISGVEASATYRLSGAASATLTIGIDRPLIPTPRGIRYQVTAPAGFDVTTSGGQGDDARLEVTLMRSVRHAVPGFLPSTHGLHFANRWSKDLPAATVGSIVNQLRARLPADSSAVLKIPHMSEDGLPLTRASSGLCGGMVYTVLDYFNAHATPPARRTTPSDAHDKLFLYIRDRLVDSFDIDGNGHRFLTYSSPLYPNGDSGIVQLAGVWLGKSWVSYRREWPKIRADIDAGRLSPMALILTDKTDIGANHQVAAYAYQRDGQRVTLWIYDPNHPDADDVRLSFDVTDTSGEVRVVRSYDAGSRIWCFFRIDNYAPKTPPA